MLLSERNAEKLSEGVASKGRRGEGKSGTG